MTTVSDPKSNADRFLSGLKALGPAAAITAFAWGAVHQIETKATEAIDKVSAAVTDVRMAQIRHEAMDDERVHALSARVTRVEDRQDGLEGTLSTLGIQAALPSERKRVKPERAE